MGKTSIEWTSTYNSDGSITSGATWNPVRGCTKISPGCKNCYAETFAERWRGVAGHPYEQGFDLRLVPEKLQEPLQWKRPRRIFVNSMSDLFQEGVPDEYIDRVWAIMLMCPRHTFQILTKRADRMLAYFRNPADLRDRLFHALLDVRNFPGELRDVRGLPSRAAVAEGIVKGWRPISPANVWLGVSAENQKYFDERVELLGQCPSPIKFVSIEPMLGPIDTGNAFDFDTEDSPYRPINWIISGCESGPRHRPAELEWFLNLDLQCRLAGVPHFHKQRYVDGRLLSTPELGGERRVEFPK